ncbi:MAG TPA: hypothetical protein VHP83_26650 [Aggregatilineaceae bacterium]|nr:hypothetical protein [Aggregatilineaceae bacterium]
MTKKKAMFYRKEVGRSESGEWITVICRMDRGRCDFVYAEASSFPGGPPAGVADSSDYQYLIGASVKSLEQMGFVAM